MMYWYGDHMNGWGYGLMAISMVLFWGLVIFAVVMLVRYLGGTGGRRDTSQPRDAEELLAERFARGEIDEEEYRNRLNALRDARRRSVGT